jgi:hypothetical protein
VSVQASIAARATTGATGAGRTHTTFRRAARHQGRKCEREYDEYSGDNPKPVHSELHKFGIPRGDIETADKLRCQPSRQTRPMAILQPVRAALSAPSPDTTPASIGLFQASGFSGLLMKG